MTLICFSRAPIDRLTAYKKRMGWQFPYVSTYDTEFPFDFGLALTPEQAKEIPQIQEMVQDPPEWLEEWGQQVGAKLEDGLREAPSFIAFAHDNGTDLPHVHGDGTRPVRRAVPRVPARPDAKGGVRRAARMAQGRVPRLTRPLGCLEGRRRYRVPPSRKPE